MIGYWLGCQGIKNKLSTFFLCDDDKSTWVINTGYIIALLYSPSGIFYYYFFYN